MKILIDASFWQQNDLTPSAWEVINRGVDGLIIRLGYSATRDSWAGTYIEQCKKFGKPYAGYWYVYTDQNLYNQASAIASAINELKPCASGWTWKTYLPRCQRLLKPRITRI
jgi:hypothetical protein